MNKKQPRLAKWLVALGKIRAARVSMALSARSVVRDETPREIGVTRSRLTYSDQVSQWSIRPVSRDLVKHAI